MSSSYNDLSSENSLNVILQNALILMPVSAEDTRLAGNSPEKPKRHKLNAYIVCRSPTNHFAGAAPT